MYWQRNFDGQYDPQYTKSDRSAYTLRKYVTDLNDRLCFDKNVRLVVDQQGDLYKVGIQSKNPAKGFTPAEVTYGYNEVGYTLSDLRKKDKDGYIKYLVDRSDGKFYLKRR